MRQFTAVLIDAQRYNVEMFARDVLMFEGNVGLLSIAHFLHVFICNLPELFIGQPVFGRWVQRYMENRITRAPIGFEVRHKTLHAGIDIHTPMFVKRFEHLLPIDHFGFIPVYFLLVVVQSPSGRGARPYIRNHSLACFARFRISILRAFSSRVRCSSMAI